MEQTLFDSERDSGPRSSGAGARGSAGADAQGQAAAATAGTGRGAPLAARTRPRTLDEFVGQGHLLGEGSALRQAIEQGRAHSMLLHGPPGSGKTTLARIVGESSGGAFVQASAVAAGRAEVRAVIEGARARSVMTVFFLDEIHRFNKAQQDALLPAVEDGVITLIGATTENPAFEVNGALLSRVRVYALQALTPTEVALLLARAAAAHLGEVPVAQEAIDFLAARSEGDARTALNALELAHATARERGEKSVGLHTAEDALQRRALLYDKAGDRHYDYISAWIKATRGSDPDASLYYLAVMLEGGEDPRFIVRRMVILASEDIGNADPRALSIATAAAQAVEHVGMPEARFALAQAAIYLSLAPKSDASGRALAAAERHVREHGAAAVPAWLRSGPRPGVKAGGESGYSNPHAHAGHVSSQALLPEGVLAERFYQPTEAERELARRLGEIRRARGLEGR